MITIPCNSGNYTSGRTQSIQYIVMHYTAGDGDTAQNNGNYFASNSSLSASAHYFVDETEVVQSVADSNTAWHCGASYYTHDSCRNANSIGVEMCSRKSNGTYYILDATVANAKELVKQLMATYNIPVENVVRHYDVTGKTCPAPWVGGTDWETFKASLVEEEEEVTEEMTYYQNLEDFPDWGQATVEKLLEKGYLNGEDDGLNLEHNMLRVLVINDRAGVYG